MVVVGLASAGICDSKEESNGKLPQKLDGSGVKASDLPKTPPQRKKIFKTKPQDIIPPKINKEMAHTHKVVDSTSSDSSREAVDTIAKKRDGVSKINWEEYESTLSKGKK